MKGLKALGITFVNSSNELQFKAKQLSRNWKDPNKIIYVFLFN